MIIIGEKLNGAIKAVAQAIKARDNNFIRDLATRQLESRADYIDICSGIPDQDTEVLEWMIDLIQTDHPDVRFSIDSPNPDTILACMDKCRNPGIINSVSLESGKTEKLFPAVAEKKGWNVIALLLDNTGMPTTVEKRMENFDGILAEAQKYGIAENRLFIDPLVFSVATTPEGFLNFIGASKLIRESHPDIHIISGLSNISFGLPYRKAINHAFLIGAMLNGMDSAIMDPLNRDMLGGVYATEALLNYDEYCIEYLSAYRDDLFGVQK
ncbi:MAG: dihydropteroate synthase [Clostridia bacterium]|nr:dihydropteroate synthase [Clostridia bacterium]